MVILLPTLKNWVKPAPHSKCNYNAESKTSGL